jgi:hypothetical protein
VAAQLSFKRAGAATRQEGYQEEERRRNRWLYLLNEVVAAVAVVDGCRADEVHVGVILRGRGSCGSVAL